jgi:transcription elongation factor/antiterminator RfaH
MTTFDLLSPAWYVLHTRSRHEETVRTGLARKSVTVFLPKIATPSRRRDRRVVLQLPLFPGYLFVYTGLAPEQHLQILKTVGAVRLIGNRKGPLPVPADAIESLKIIVATNSEVETGTTFRRGDRVMVTRGPFTGVSGVFVRYKGHSRIMVNIEALGQFAAVEVQAEDVIPLSDAAR